MQQLLPFFRRTAIVVLTHHEADALWIVGTGGASLDVGTTLLEFADDGLVALFAIDVAEEFAINVMLAFTEVPIWGNHHALAVVIGHAVIQLDVFP